MAGRPGTGLLTILCTFALATSGCGGTSGAHEPDVTSFEQFDEEPVILYRPAPEYPKAAIDRGLEGQVYLSVTVEADARISEVRVVGSSDPVFEPAAVASAKRYVFRPASRDGKPIRSRVMVTIRFVRADGEERHK